MYHIFHIPTSFSDKEIHLSAKIHNILFLFAFFRHTIAETPDFCQIVYFCQIVSIAMLSAVSKITLGYRLVAAIFAGCECKHSRPAHYPRKKRGPPPTVMNPTKPEILNRKRRFLFFQAISLYFRQIVPDSAMPTSIPQTVRDSSRNGGRGLRPIHPSG